MKVFKNGMKIVMALLVLLALVGCATQKKEEETQVVGGWQTVEDGTITAELQEIFDKATEQLEGVDYKAVKLLETQVVSGTNYKFLCDATVVAPDAQTKQVIMTVYQNLQGEVEVLDITDAE